MKKEASERLHPVILDVAVPDTVRSTLEVLLPLKIAMNLLHKTVKKFSVDNGLPVVGLINNAGMY